MKIRKKKTILLKKPWTLIKNIKVKELIINISTHKKMLQRFQQFLNAGNTSENLVNEIL